MFAKFGNIFTFSLLMLSIMFLSIRASFARRDAVFICHFIFLSLGDHCIPFKQLDSNWLTDFKWLQLTFVFSEHNKLCVGNHLCRARAFTIFNVICTILDCVTHSLVPFAQAILSISFCNKVTLTNKRDPWYPFIHFLDYTLRKSIE